MSSCWSRVDLPLASSALFSHNAIRHEPFGWYRGNLRKGSTRCPKTHQLRNGATCSCWALDTGDEITKTLPRRCYEFLLEPWDPWQPENLEMHWQSSRREIKRAQWKRSKRPKTATSNSQYGTSWSLWLMFEASKSIFTISHKRIPLATLSGQSEQLGVL